MAESRAFKAVFNQLSNEELTAPEVDVTLDPDDPQTIADLDLPEYAELKQNTLAEFPEGTKVSQEGWLNDNWQNLKNRFESEMDHDNIWIKKVQHIIAEVTKVVTAASHGDLGKTPVNIYANLYYLTSGKRKPANATQLLQELRRSADLVAYVEKTYMPALAKQRKIAIDIMASGSSPNNLAKASQNAYSMTAKNPIPGLERLLTNKRNTRIQGNGITQDGMIRTSDPYMGGFEIAAFQMVKMENWKDPRGDKVYGQYSEGYHDKLQIKAATRDEALALLKLADETLDATLRIAESSNYRQGVHILDAMEKFSAAYKNYANYPKAEREQIMEIYNCGATVRDAETVANFAINTTMRVANAIQLYIKKSMTRYK